MRTNLVQTLKESVKRINLNCTIKRVALFSLFIFFAISNAWGANYYASLNISQAGPTGAGSVYVANSNTKPDTPNPGTAVPSTVTTTSGGNVTMYWWVDINPGYNVTLSGKVTGGPYAAASASGNVSCAASTRRNSTQDYTATATFVAVTVNSVDNASINLYPTNATADYPFTVRFSTSNLKTIALDLDKFPDPTDGMFTITNWSLDGTDVVATGKFNGGGSYGGASHSLSTTVSLNSKASGSTAKTCVVTANFPELAFVDANVTDVYTTANDATKTGSTEFNFNYGAEDDFPTMPSFAHTSGPGAFTVTGYTVTPNYSAGTCKVTVFYSFNPNGVVGTTKEELTLTSAGGLSTSVTVTGEAEVEATNDASVTTTANVTTEYETFAAALAAANATSGATLKLLRNVDLGTITATNNITKAMTIDLNGKELRAAVNASSVGILTITQAVAVTIKDSKTGGKIINEVARNSEIRTIFVNKAGATLTLESGTLAVNNKGQYASADNATLGVTKYASCSSRVIHQVAGSTVNINGGRLEAYGTRSVYGIVQGSSAATNQAGTTVLNITDGEIYSEGPYNIFGVYAYGKVNFSGGAINVHVTTDLIDAYYAADNANNLYNGYGYGIYLYPSASATATSCYAGILNMTGGTINVTNDRTYNVNRPHYGVLFGATAANVSSATAVAADGKSRGQIASATGSIDGGEINVTSGTQYSYGVYVGGSYNSYDNTNHVVQIKNCKITSKAYVYAYGVNAYAAINSTNGACYAGDVELTNCDIYAESLNTSTAAAVWVTATSSTIFKDGTTANAATWGGEFAVAGKAVINSGKYEAKTKTTSAYAVGTSSRAKTTYDAETTVYANRKLGGKAEAYPVLIIHGGTFKATTSGTNTTARAVSNGGYCTIDGGSFDAYAGGTTAHGLYCLTGKITASGVKVTASATQYAYGALADVSIPGGNQAQTGFTMAGELELNNCDITATTRTSTEARGVSVNATNKLHNWAQFLADSTSYTGSWAANKNNYAALYKRVFPCLVQGRDSIGISTAGKATINGGSITATAATTTAYGVYAVGSQDLMLDSIAIPEVTVKNAKITATTNGTTSAWGIYTQGKTLVDGCDITVTPKTTTGYGIQAIAANDTKVTVRNTKITVNATTTAYGLYGQVDINTKNGQDRHGNFVLEDGNDVTANATSGNTSYAVFLNATKRAIVAPETTPTDISAYRLGNYANAATAVINGGKYTATATGTTAYGIGMTAQQVQVAGSVVSQPECTVNGGKFWGKATGGTDGAVDNKGVNGHFVLKGGVYNVNTNLATYIPDGYEAFPLPEDRPEYAEGYRYAIEEAGNHGIYVCQIGTTKYKSLEEALQVVASNQVIYMIADYAMMTSGDYILPSGATLLIPYKTGSGAGATTAIGNSAKTTTSGTTPTLFRKLTFGPGVNLTCSGTIETSAEQKVNGQYGANVGMASGAYGQIHLMEGSHISIENGARLNCWGFVTGKGTIEVKNGGKILEGFQMGDWCGGTNYNNVFKSASTANYVFPITHYFYQSIECPITYRPGCRAYGSTHVNVTLAGTVGQDDVPLVGTSGSMFIMDDNDVSKETWVMKDYDEATDQCIWTINSGASIGNLTISISGYNMQSANYDLPITTNMSIVLNYGDMGIGQNTVMLPGSKLIVNKQGTAVIDGVTVVAYDASDWTGSKRYFATYSPTWGTTNPRSSLPVEDAEIFMHGKVNIKGNGGLYTTPSGANIHSTNADAGEVIYTTAATGNKTSYYLNQGGTTRPSLTVNPAKLKNGDGSYETSAGTVAGKTWTYINDIWQCWSKDGCFFVDAQDHPYAKPAEQVQLTSKTPDANHLHHDAATGARNFVWDENCYWWEVSTTPTQEGYYQSLNADNNGKYNYYEYVSASGCWKIKTITVTWSINGNNTNYTVGYGTKPHWLGATPTKASSSSDYVWRWDGWTVGSDPTVLGNEELPYVTSNTTFTAHFYEKYYQSLVTFKNDDGTILDSRLWNRGTMPSYSGTPAKVSTDEWDYEFNNTWSPTITTVGNSAAEYVAQYTQHKRKYNITFYDYDMSVWNVDNIEYGTAASCSKGNPSRATTAAYSYNFAGWKDKNGTLHTGTLPNVTSATYYVAKYDETERRYVVTWNAQGGTCATSTTERAFNVAIGALPVPSKTGYEFVGWYTEADGGDQISASTKVTEDVTYYAHYSLATYNITYDLKDGSVATPNPTTYTIESAPITLVNPTKEGCDFAGWTGTGLSGATTEVIISTGSSGHRTYTANWAPHNYTITYNLNDGSVSPANPETYNVETATFILTNPTKTGYTFTGWTGSNGTTPQTNVTIAHGSMGDKSYTANWTINQYTISFNSNGGSVVADITQNYNTAVTAPADPTKTGYTFAGWNPAVPSTMPANDANCVAQWTINQYTISFNSNGGSAVTAITQNYNTAVTAPANPTKTGYTFAGWNPAVPSTMPATNTTCVAQWTPVPYNITYNLNGGSATNPGTYNIETATFTLNNPTRTGYTFDGWTGSNGSTPQTNVSIAKGSTGDRTYTANWTAIPYNITFANLNGNGSSQTIQVAYDQHPTSPVTPEKVSDCETYPFIGWKNSSNQSFAANAELPLVTSNETYTAQFSSTSEKTKFTVSFNVQGHGVAPAEQSVDCNAVVGQPASPTAEGYTFLGWYKEDGCTNAWNFGTDVVTRNTTLFASWQINQYTISFNSNYGSSVAPISQNYGTSVTPPANPTRTGFTFNGWNPAVPATMPATNMTCVAQWTPNTNTAYTVKHYKQKLDGTYATTPDDTDNLTGTTGESVTPARKSYEGFTAPAGQSAVISADGSRVVEYRYTRNSYTLAWSTDGDALTGSYTTGTVKFGAPISAPNTPTKTGYTFAGWSPAFTSTMPAENTTFAATWTPNTNTAYTVKHYKQNLDGTYPASPDDTDNLTGTTATNVTPNRKSYDGFNQPEAQTKAIAADGNMVIEYKYTRKSYNLTWNANGGTITGTSHTSGSVLYGASVTAPANANVTRDHYDFAGWNTTPATTMPASDLTYTAQWTPKQYTITWLNEDNSQFDQTTVAYGTVPTHAGPTKAATAEYTYTFAGWSPTPVAVIGATSYKATFNQTKNSYTIRWLNDNGSQIDQTTVEYGTVPTHADPEKVIDNCKYDFQYWTPTPVAVTGDAEYTAKFSDDCTMDNFLVVFQNYDGTPLYATEIAGGATPVYGGETPTKPSGDVYNEFTGWSPALGSLSNHTVYTAQYTEQPTAVATVTTSAGVITWYTTWSSALTEAKKSNGNTITLYANVTPDNNTEINKNMTIDLNGHTISLTNATNTTNPQLFNVNNVALTIEDSQGTGQIYYKNTAAPTSNSNTALYCRTFYVTGASGSLTINGGTIKAGATGRKSSGGWSSTYYYANAVAVYVNGNNATTPQVTINGGELIATETYSTQNNRGNGYAVMFSSNASGHADVKGGKLQAKTSIFLNQAAARATLTGGYYNSNPSTNVTIPTTHEAVATSELSGYTYKVRIKSTANCTITWKQDDGTQINQTTITSGGTPTHTDPSKGGGDLHQYEFAGWNPEVGAVTTDMTYMATYHLMVKIGWNVDGNITYSWVRFGDTPEYTEGTPTKAETAQYSYTFTGWSPEVVPATCPKTYTAQFDEVLRSYTITFANLDGNNSQQAEYEFAYGATPVCLVTPMKEEGGKAYEFWGWTPEIEPVTGIATYTATFSDTPSKTVYTITWKDDQGNTIETTKVAEDDLPTHAAPDKANTAEWTYTFTGWTPTVVPATADAEYQATFSSVKNKYTITFEDWDGTVLSSELMEYGTAPSISNPTREAYTFNGWSPAIASVTADATYTATYTFSGNVASVTNAAGTSTVYYTTWADALTAANNSAGCTLRIYTDIPLTSYQTLSKNMTIDLNGCTISRVGSGNVLFLVSGINLIVVDSHTGGKLYHEAPTNQNARTVLVDGSGSVTINGGTIEGKATNNSYSGSAVVLNANTATVTINEGVLIGSHTGTGATYAVYGNGYTNIYGGKLNAKTSIFYNATAARTKLYGGYYTVDPTSSNGTVQTGYAKQPVTSSEEPEEYGEGYRYKVVKTSCVVTWNNYDGSTITTTAVSGGSTPDDDGITPTKTPAAIDQYEYVFAGWDPELGVITDDITYTAQFTPVVRSYTITWQDGDGNTLQTGEAEYGQVPAYTSLSIPTKTATAEYSYSFNSTWSPTPYAVDKDQIYTAQFNEIANKYTLTWELDGGSITADGTPAGKVAYGTTLTAPVVEKTGYTFNGWSPVEPSTMPAENATYTATWTPRTDINYTVKHWQQNLLNDYYTEVTTDQQTLQGTTGTSTAAVANTYTGFAAQSFSQGTIAGDGLTVVNIYYNRNKYTITWVNGNGTTLKTDENVKYGATPNYDGATPTKLEDANYTYTFNGTWTPDITTVTDNATYTAQFNAVPKETGDRLDIVEWTTNTLTLNLNGIPAAGWPYTIIVGEDSHSYEKTARAADRTLTISYSGSADDELCITVTNKSEVTYSKHKYIVPHINNFTDVNENSIVYVNNGTVTVSSNTTVNAVYVAPGAELVVSSNKTLTVDSIMLRTTPWEAAILDNQGSIVVPVGKAYYTRIIADNSKYYQFALPLSSNVKNVRLSNGAKCTYNTSWILKSYEEALRADNGPINTEEKSNWKLLTTGSGEGEDNGVITASRGYEMFSNTPYYREFYFPVTLPSSPTREVGVSYTKPDDKSAQWIAANSGWNALCSPLLSKYVQTFGNYPEDGLKVSELQQDGCYAQYVPQTVYPAIPFYYQASKAGKLYFNSGSKMILNAPRREWNASIPTQWLQLTIQNTNGNQLDETSIYMHPEKFVMDYETGYDVAKQSLQGGKALLYSELPCGKLAFAAVPDSLAETRIPLTAYAAAEGEYIFSMVENNYLGRLQYVFLHDTQTGLVTDLLERDYAANLTQGTNAGRFYIQCVFAADAPEVTTGVNHIESENEQAQKIIYNDKVYIIYQGRVYDMTGRQCELK